MASIAALSLIANPVMRMRLQQLKRKPARPAPELPTEERLLQLRAEMYAARINAGFCPVCEPVKLLDDEGRCTNPECAFARGDARR